MKKQKAYVSTVTSVNMIDGNFLQKILYVSLSDEKTLDVMNKELDQALNSIEQGLVETGLDETTIILHISDENPSDPCRFTNIGQTASITTATTTLLFILRTEEVTLDEINETRFSASFPEEIGLEELSEQLGSALSDALSSMNFDEEDIHGNATIHVDPDSDLAKMLDDMADKLSSKK